MKIISFNINGLRARLHQLQALIDKHQPDVIGLQEIKVHNDAFPLEAVEAMGYHVYFHGQKAHYGVAMLCKQKPSSVQYGFPTDTDDHQKRMIMATFDDENGKKVTVLNGYFPQGDNIAHESKFPYKRQFYSDLMTYLDEHHTPEDNVIVMGDINISPIDLDIGIGEPNKKRWLKTGKCSFQPVEREWLKRLLDWGFIDTFRQLHPTVDDQYSWFDYRSKGFVDNRGLRIDVVLATQGLAQDCTEAGIDYELRGIEKPSDHAPIWSSFK
ncbi:exodeoxyribonuclease III [Vibrio sp. 10N.286.49.C2]|uniref:exodeoxyribonuclease III n=1 Tax=unclassified Vibrio TaxID=2614977 RepID=UPI000C859B90|nr:MULTISPECIES: exodeoxyribonuclease III [unclassified Vibrio]PMH33683.1 exodeoxyribonuclease III [Vibrio sp. 10N.286.49.C2]PMH43940.1 exodeoxyribonuclease III [Vibrio sp. 10N.286.49.B1]PMH83527.1 exodeoxyribonuclease III [Vibrio sp. 10N.286.48.B7]